MKTYEYNGDPFTKPRSHPWVDAVGNPDSRYYDFTATPALIRSSLEDFRPWSSYAAIEAFYVLLEWLNQPGSTLESNDCAFVGPVANDNPNLPKALQCSGRVMLLFRDLEMNTHQSNLVWLKNQLHSALESLDPDFSSGVIGTTILPVRYLALPERDDQQLGEQLMVSFWAWGDTQADIMLNLGRVMKNVSDALQTVSAQAALAMAT